MISIIFSKSRFSRLLALSSFAFERLKVEKEGRDRGGGGGAEANEGRKARKERKNQQYHRLFFFSSSDSEDSKIEA